MGAQRSPKVARLQRLTGMRKVETVGTLELLWLFTMEQTPRGDIGKWDDGDIEDACGWAGEAGELVAALCDAKWLDACPEHRLVVHDWAEHAPAFLKKRDTRSSAYFVSRCQPLSDNGSQREHRVGKSREAKVGRESRKPTRSRKSSAKTFCPPFAEWDQEELVALAATTKLQYPADRTAVVVALERVVEWSAEKDMKRTRRGWNATVRRAIREKWAEKANGHDKPEARARRNSADVERLLRGPEAAQDRARATNDNCRSTGAGGAT